VIEKNETGGEPGLRGELLAAGAEKSSPLAKHFCGVERSDRKRSREADLRAERPASGAGPSLRSGFRQKAHARLRLAHAFWRLKFGAQRQK